MVSSSIALVDSENAVDRVAVKHLLAYGADPNQGLRRFKPLHALIQLDPHNTSATPVRTRFENSNAALIGTDPLLVHLR